jgi:hypothetical protein
MAVDRDAFEPDAGYALTMFLLTFSLALTLVLGIVVDGGAVLAERRSAINSASSAARIGAAAIDRSGNNRMIDPVRARQEIDAYLSAKGLRYDLTFDCVTGCRSVTVTVRSTARLKILGVVGVRSRDVAGAMTARPSAGTNGENG